MRPRVAAMTLGVLLPALACTAPVSESLEPGPSQGDSGQDSHGQLHSDAVSPEVLAAGLDTGAPAGDAPSVLDGVSVVLDASTDEGETAGPLDVSPRFDSEVPPVPDSVGQLDAPHGDDSAEVVDAGPDALADYHSDSEVAIHDADTSAGADSGSIFDAGDTETTEDGSGEVCDPAGDDACPPPPYDPCELITYSPIKYKPTVCPGLEPVVAAVETSVNLDGWFFDGSGEPWCDFEFPCSAHGGIKGILPVDADHVVIGGTGHISDPFGSMYEQYAVVARFDSSGKEVWSLELGAAGAFTYLHAISFTDEGSILVLATEAVEGANGFGLPVRWLVTPDGTILNELHVQKWDGLWPEVATPFAGGALSIGSRSFKVPQKPCGEVFATRYTNDGTTVWAKTYSAMKGPSPAWDGLDGYYSRLAVVPGAGSFIATPLKISHSLVHMLRLDEQGEPTGRWVYDMNLVGAEQGPLVAGAASDSVFFAHRLGEPVKPKMPVLVRISPWTGAIKDAVALEESPEESLLVQGAFGTPSGLVLLSTGYEFPKTQPIRATEVHVYPPSGCPVMTYAFPGLLGAFDKLPRGFKVITRLGNGSFAAAAMPAEYSSPSRLHFLELPAVAELEEQLSAGVDSSAASP